MEGEEDFLSHLQQRLSSDPEYPSNHFNLGIFLWKKGDIVGGDESKDFKSRAAEHFLASARLNPGDSASFRILGHYYSAVVVDTQRAFKCYQRALSLSPDDFEAGDALCDLLDVNGKESLEIAVCKEASEKSPRAFWAFRRLGYLQIYHKKWEEAVQSLQHAIRGYPACADLWEALGLAYHRLGRLTAAIKSYGRAIELEDSKIFSLIESGNILLMLGSFRKGIELFRHALEVSPQNVSAHFGLASGLLGLSKECASIGAYEWGASLLKDASEITSACSHLSSNFSSVWKLHGDIQIAYAKCLPWENKITSTHIDEGAFKASIIDWKNSCLSAAKNARLLYQRALHLTPWQSNIYADIAITIDLIYSLLEREKTDHDTRQLSERMSLGSLMFEGVNCDFWVILACVTNDYALKQHALIRGLQLDNSLAVSWAYLGKLYMKLGENHLATQSFDRARSLDPSLALPWAGMSVASHDRNYSLSEAYESCLRAVQIMPLAEFQIGLGMLAAVSGHLLSPQVFSAIRHSIQRSPYYPESHNVHGLICEARSDYQSAISAYRLARSALRIASLSKDSAKHCLTDVSVNLARALCQAGHMLDAEQECEALNKDGMLNCKGLQIYAVALWKLGKNDQSLHVARNLAKNVSTMEESSCTAAIGLICQLIYRISGLESAISTILKLPREYLNGAKMSLILSTINALDPNNRLQLLLPTSLSSFGAYDLIVEMHTITATNKMIQNGSEQSLDIHSGIKYLKKVLRLYPDSKLLRNHLGSLILYSGDWLASHIAPRCTVLPTGYPVRTGLKSPFEIHGGAGVSCYASCVTRPKFSFPACRCQPMHGSTVTDHLQKWLHQEPWNHEARYLLILNLLQRAREEKFPPHLCIGLKRLISIALSMINETKYQRFLLLLSASEISLQCQDYSDCTNYAATALELLPSNDNSFFAHLQLCRAYAAHEDLENLRNEYMNCLKFNTVNQIGWLSLKYLESRYKLQNGCNTVDMNYKICFTSKLSSSNMWVAVFGLVSALCFIWDNDFISAEQALAHACSISKEESCLFFAHGAVCMELARQQMGLQFLSRALQHLVKAQVTSPFPLPILSALLAQVEGSLGSKAKWERNLRLEWFSWPAEMRPAELYFQMHILARQSTAACDPQTNIESYQSPLRWVLRAVHLNPSCLRYWKVLQKLAD
ncbi:tetratricopeptide repeat protein SKI3 [Dendrobium catenatum]|uniref:Putative UDP-N-acetylglucosamine--peptide N-acetylglucosaminyltransferase SEC n=1 Tax=Dendrobium catenatum TaxID=906689 RepID=A0A2I0WPX7_9ASPA|nr:tetratricopeptide repeat protein SKI3 [Dendrobium catenatum]PKU77719.1 putative UDP-N-acetylglucosamine--peptide N-acetylglucosaminyltransferase SEC [Dendrobium catenatum]